VQVWQLDDVGRADIAGYGYCCVPSSAGSFTVSGPVEGNTSAQLERRILSFLLGGLPDLEAAWHRKTRADRSACGGKTPVEIQ
jgi:hypothetical protein